MQICASASTYYSIFNVTNRVWSFTISLSTYSNYATQEIVPIIKINSNINKILQDIRIVSCAHSGAWEKH